MALQEFFLRAVQNAGLHSKPFERVFGPACVYGQVIKTRRNDRVVRVKRRPAIGAGSLEQALRDSEDSASLNTSYVERLNLTIRQGSAYLGRRTLCQARRRERLEDHLELLRCHYNFVRYWPVTNKSPRWRIVAAALTKTRKSCPSVIKCLRLSPIALVQPRRATSSGTNRRRTPAAAGCRVSTGEHATSGRSRVANAE